MKRFILIYFSLSIFIPAIIALFKFKKSDYKDRFFYYFIFISAGLDILLRYLKAVYKNNLVVFNIFALTDLVFLVLAFYTWGLFQKKKHIVYWIIGVFSVFWIIEHLILSSVLRPNPYSRVFSSIIITLLSINMISKSLIMDKQVFYKNYKFLAALGAFLLYSNIAAISFFWFNTNAIFTGKFQNLLNISQEITNLCTNLLYALALLWMIPYRKFTMQ